MQLKIYVPKHPLIEHLCNLIQSVDVPPMIVRNSAVELSYWLCYEAMRSWISLADLNSRNLDGTVTTQLISPQENLLALPFIKSGLLMTESIHKLSSNVNFFYVGFQDINSSYDVADADQSFFNDLGDYSKFLILDSVVLSSDKILALLSVMSTKGVDLSLIRIVFLLCTSDVLQDIGQAYPNLTIYTSSVKDSANITDLSPYKLLLEHLQT
nr:hypothetical protein [Erythrotrichia foliiformis]